MDQEMKSWDGGGGCERWLEHLDSDSHAPEALAEWESHVAGCEECARSMSLWEGEIAPVLSGPLPGAGIALRQRILEFAEEATVPAGMEKPAAVAAEKPVPRISMFPWRSAAAIAILAGAALTMLHPERAGNGEGAGIAGGGKDRSPLHSEADLVYSDLMAGARTVGSPVKSFLSAVTP